MDLQAAINTASSGATLQIPDNERCIGNFVIDKPLTIVGGINSTILAGMGNEFPAVYIPPGTGPVVLRKLNISLLDTITRIGDIVRYGGSTFDTGQTSLDKCPQGLWLDECDVFGLPTAESQRGISANGANFKATKTKVREIHGKGYDTQAICSWNGPGPFLIEGCYLEAAGENVMFGGALPIIQDLIHSDIAVRRCVFFKPPAWRGVWTVKNLFELKNARRVVVEGNVFDGNWTDAQAGRAIAFTPRPSDSGSWALIEDVLFQHNVIRNVGSGLIVLGADEAPAPTETRLRRIAVRNNVWLIDGPKYGSNGAFATVINKTEDVSIEHNTVIQTGSIVVTDYEPNTRFSYRNNVSRHNEYGIFGSGVGIGNAALAHYFPGSIVDGNVIAKEINAPSNVESLYPAGNHFPAALAAVGFVDLGAGNYRLSDSSPYKGKGTDGKDPGCDIEALLAAQGGLVSTPTPTPEPTPSPTNPIPVPSGSTVTDSTGGVWTIGLNKETLRNGTQMGGGQGTEYRYVDKVVYVFGLDNNWWRWANGWLSAGPTEPGGTVTEPTPTPTPEPRILLWPNDKAAQNVIWEKQASEGYRSNRHVERPKNMPKGNYVEFVKW